MTLVEKVRWPLNAGRNVLLGAGHALDLGIRLYLAKVFSLTGLTKIRDWETTVMLFENEYRVPVLSPELAAFMGTAGELLLPVASPHCRNTDLEEPRCQTNGQSIQA